MKESLVKGQKRSTAIGSVLASESEAVVEELRERQRRLVAVGLEYHLDEQLS